MSKIYVFGIGGTGSRVLRAVTLLLASGVECKADAIVPIIIDPDAAAGDVERTVRLMKEYGSIRSKLNFDGSTKNQFFKTDIMQSMDNFRLPLSNTEDVTFDRYMGVSDMSTQNKALANMLFSQKNLAADMKVGFKGNPNIGSVVLNQFEQSEQFLNFANEFTDQDKIFIISSIFGGTGASGFPLLLKTLRTSENIANRNYVNNAHIGAITVLPYFQVKQDESSQIDSTTFISKAKSALSYYNLAISQNNAIDSLYYVADDTRTTYENCEGGNNQKNNAHFIELVSALAIIDFANSEKGTTKHKEFGIKEDKNEIIFEDLSNRTRNRLRKSMTQFLLFSKYLNENDIPEMKNVPWKKDLDFDNSFFNGDFIRTLETVQKEYQTWLSEMTTQQRAFTPFFLHQDKDRVFDLIKGVRPRKLYTILDSNYDLYNRRLNGQKEKCKSGQKEYKFMELFYLGTQELVKDKFNIE